MWATSFIEPYVRDWSFLLVPCNPESYLERRWASPCNNPTAQRKGHEEPSIVSRGQFLFLYCIIKPLLRTLAISSLTSTLSHTCKYLQSDTLEERYAIKFCFKLGKNATETYGMLQTAFRPSCMNRASVFEWHKSFKWGRESVRDDERYGRSKEINTPELIGQRVRLRVTMLRF